MADSRPKPGDRASYRGPRSLVEACRASGHDRAGGRCPECPLRLPCESERRWLVPRRPEPGLRPRYLH